MSSQYDRTFRNMKKRVMALKLPLNSKRSIIGQLRSLDDSERQALYRKVIQRYGGNAK